MKGTKILTVLVLLMVSVMVSQICAAQEAKPDQAGVLAKLDEAAKAEKPADASKAAQDAAAMVEKAAAGSGEYGEAVGGAVGRKLKELADAYAKEDKALPVTAEIAVVRVKHLFSALLPAAAGDLAAPAAYLKAAVAAAPAPAKEQMEAAVKALAGEDKDLAVRSMKVAITAAYLGKAYTLVGEKNYRHAGRWITEAADYLKVEAGASTDRSSDIQDASALLRSEVPDLSQNIPVEQEDITGLFKTVEHAFLGAKAAE